MPQSPRSPDTPSNLVQGMAWGLLAIGVLGTLIFGVYRQGLLPFTQAGEPAEAETLNAEVIGRLAQAWALMGGQPGALAGDLTEVPDRLAQAREAIDQALELAPDLPAAHVHDGLHRLASKDLVGAEAALRRALELDPDVARAHLLLGVVHAEGGDPAAAEVAFRRAVELDPTSPEAHHNLGQTLWSLGRQDEALDAYRRKIALKHGSSVEVEAEVEAEVEVEAPVVDDPRP